MEKVFVLAPHNSSRLLQRLAVNEAIAHIFLSGPDHGLLVTCDTCRKKQKCMRKKCAKGLIDTRYTLQAGFHTGTAMSCATAPEIYGIPTLRDAADMAICVAEVAARLELRIWFLTILNPGGGALRMERFKEPFSVSTGAA